MNRTPATNKPLIPGLPVGIIGLNDKAGINREIETGFVVKVDADAVVAQLGGELHAFDDFAFGLGKAQNLAEPIGGNATL